MASPLYSAALGNQNTIDIINVEKGVVTYRISLAGFQVVNGPIVTADKMTVIIKDSVGRTTGRVYSLPKGILSYSFQVG
jgi:hypothetical protein